MEKLDDDDNNNFQDNSTYDNLKIYEEQNNICIKFIYDISYLNYKKKIFSEMNNNYNSITNIFDNNICDTLINIYILKKKNKIYDKHFNIIKFIFDYVKKLNEINHIDSENFFMVIIDLYKIDILCIWINTFFEKFIFKELIDYKILTDKINNLFVNLSKKIFIFKIFDELIKINDDNLIKQKITYLAHKISFDLFMFYNSNEIFNAIIGCFIYLDEIISVDNNDDNLYFLKKNNLDLITKNKTLSYIFEKNKSLFIKEYDKNTAKCIEIYSNDIELYIKFKITKNEIIDKFIKNIAYIDNI